jgi:hypothetical protein
MSTGGNRAARVALEATAVLLKTEGRAFAVTGKLKLQLAAKAGNRSKIWHVKTLPYVTAV